MTLHKNVGENTEIDSGKDIEDVSYEPQEAETDIVEEKSDAQRLKDGDVVLDIDKTDEVEVSPHSIYKPSKKKEEGEEEEEVEEGEEEVVEVKEEKEEVTEEEQEEEVEPEEVEKKPAAAPDAVQKRINKITREKYEARREADKLKKELAEAKKKLEETEFEKKKSDLVKERPKEEDFDSEEDYHVALGRWAAKTEIHESSAPLEEVEEVVEEEPKDAVQEIISMGKETYPDFEELVLREDLKITPLMVEAAVDSEHATDIFYHLGQHPELADKIAKMRSPAKVAREIGRIEFEFIKDEVEEVVTHDPTEDTEEVVENKPKKKKKIAVAPPPVKPLGGGGKTSKNLEDMGLAEYYEARGYTRDGMEKRRVS